jgi:MFS family permease
VDPTAIGLLTISGGALAIVENVVAGWGSDRWGRQRVALVCILGQVGWTLASYSVSGPLLVVAWVGQIVMALGEHVTLSAFGGRIISDLLGLERPQGCVWSS